MEEERNRHYGGRPRKIVKREMASGIRFTIAEYFLVKQKAS